MALHRNRGQGNLFKDVHVSFGDAFFDDHAGNIIRDGRVAIVELIANAYDAVATEVRIQWPLEVGGPISIRDNGTGMTRAELQHRWTQLCYQRQREQGKVTEFKGIKRIPFGHSGKGRHSAFCFADSYIVETWRDGEDTVAEVELTHGTKDPFRFAVQQGQPVGGEVHGTEIRATIERNILSPENIRELIGDKFIADPQFKIILNNQQVELLDLANLETDKIEVPEVGAVLVHRIMGADRYRTTQLQGVTWWANRRMVGKPSWGLLEGYGSYLDGRSNEAGRLTFIVEADSLLETRDVLEDWSGFQKESPRFEAVRKAVHAFIEKALDSLFTESTKDRKRQVIQNSAAIIKTLPVARRTNIGRFVDEVLVNCKSVKIGDLQLMVQTLANLEQSKSKFALLELLARCTPDNLDTWTSIMQRWTADQAELILGELQWRLDLIKQLEKLVQNPTADELHEIHPVFEQGLWIFGPEYEAIDFASNRSITTVIRKFFDKSALPVSRNRTDIVALRDSSIRAYTADAYEASDGGEVSGLRKVLVVELKRGGLPLTRSHVMQAWEYAALIRQAGGVGPDTTIEVYVLGKSPSSDIGDTTEKNICIRPRPYATILERAHSRTFHLLSALEKAKPHPEIDPDVEKVVAGPVQERFANM